MNNNSFKQEDSFRPIFNTQPIRTGDEKIRELEDRLKEKENLLQSLIQKTQIIEHNYKVAVTERENIKQKSMQQEKVAVEFSNKITLLEKELEKLAVKDETSTTNLSQLQQRNNYLEKENRDIKQQIQTKESEIAKPLQEEIEKLKKQIKSVGFEHTIQNPDNRTSINFTEFYDAIIDIPNMRDLVNGWKINFKDWKQYQELAKKQCTIVSVIGNYGKGKTFLLELLTGNHLLHGFNVNTQGISVVYLKDHVNKQRPIMALDTKGGGNPLQIHNLEKNDSENAKGEINSDSLTERLRDHSATEDLLQNFILEVASIIIVVVSDLTFDDQRLVNKIMSKYKADATKKIIVVHNLYHTHYVADVETKIKDSILPSFMLEEVAYKSLLNENNNEKYFVETSRGKVPHLIIAKQHSEAGDFYNSSSIRYILDCLNSNDNNERIDIIQYFHKYLQKSFGKYIQSIPEFKEENIVIQTQDDDRPVAIHVENIQSMQMKAVVADVFGDLQIFKDGFCPNYTLNKETIDGAGYLCLKIECPDACSDVKSKIDHLNVDEFFIQVKGKKGQTSEGEIILNNRQCGDFFIKTTNLKKAIYGIYYDVPPTKVYENGMFVLRWKLNDQGDPDW